MKNFITILLLISLSATAQKSFVAVTTLGTVSNSYTGYIGFKFTVSKAINVSQLGRYIVSGNNKTHVLKIVDLTGKTLAQGSVNTVGQVVGSFAYVPVTVSLSANTYYLLSQELSGGDQWHHFTNVITTDGLISNPAYSSNGVYVSVTGGAGQTYGPLDFKYDLQPSPFETYLKGLPGYGPDKVLYGDFIWRTVPNSVFYLKPPLYPVNDSTIGYR